MESFLEGKVVLTKKEAKELNTSTYRKMMDYVFETGKCSKEMQSSFKDMERSSIEVDLSKGYVGGFYMSINNGEDPEFYGYEYFEFAFNQFFEVVGAELYNLNK